MRNSPGGLTAAGLFFVFWILAVQPRRPDCKSGSGPYVFEPAVPRRQPISTNPQIVSAKLASASV